MSMIFESFDWNIQGCCHLYQILIYETCKQCFQSLCATSDNLFYIVVCTFSFGHCIYQIFHGTKGHMAVYGPGCHPQNIIWTEAKPQNIIWTEAKLRSIYYFVGDRPVHKLPYGPKCHELFVILYSIHANLSDDMLLLLYI